VPQSPLVESRGFYLEQYMFYVYLHINPITNEPFYVGKGKNNRAYSSYGRNKLWHNVVNKYGKVVQFVAEGITEEESICIERSLIEKYGRRDKGTGILVNMTDGGDGVSGKVYTPTEKKILSDSMKAYYSIPDSIEKRRITAKKTNAIPEVKKKISDALKQVNKDKSFIERKRKNTKKSWEDVVIRHRRTEKIKQTRSSLASRAKTSLCSQKSYEGFISPSGQVYRDITNLSEFCSVHKITKNGMYGLASGKLNQHKGWKRII
jgi:hypothetical protein